MSNFAWAQAQLNLGNSVRRASAATVYVKMHQPAWSPNSIPGVFYVSDDSWVRDDTFYFSIDDAHATDWELHSATGTQMNWGQANTEIRNGNKIQRLAYPQVMLVGHFSPPGTFQREFLFDVSETNLIEANALENDYSYSMDDVIATDWVLVP